MATIIDNTYFKYDLAIPQAIAQPSITSNTPDNVDAVTDCIKHVEKDLLLNALGVTIYADLQAALPITDGSVQKWKDLVNGVTYDGKMWDGLKDEKSLIAYAVYYNFLDENSSFWTTLGVEKPKAENSQSVNPAYKLATAWQKFLKKYQNGLCIEPLRYKTTGATFTDYYGNNEDVNVSLYQYLRDNKEVYGWEDSNFKYYEQRNSFGL